MWYGRAKTSKCIYRPEYALLNHFPKSRTTVRPESVTSIIVSRAITRFLWKVGCSGLYVGGSQHTRRSSFPGRTSQIQPSFRSLNNVFCGGGSVSPTAHSGWCWAGMGKTPWSVMMELWLSSKEQNVVRCAVSHSKRRWTCFVDLADETSQRHSVPSQFLVSRREPSAAHATYVCHDRLEEGHMIIVTPETASIKPQ